MVAAILLAISLSSPSIGSFMKLPSWMPTNVTEECTFGSEDHADPSVTHRVTTNTLAAVEAIFEAYYERLYYLSATGDVPFANMFNFAVSNDSVFCYSHGTNATHEVPDTRRFCEKENMTNLGKRIHDLIDLTTPPIQIGSYSNYHRTTYFSSTLLETNMPPEYSWTTTSPFNANLVGACHPLISCRYDTFYHLEEIEDASDYPIADLYNRFCGSDFYTLGYRHFRALQLHPAVPSILAAAYPDSEFTSVDTNFTHVSWRLHPDDGTNYTAEARSSVMAIASRTLGALDITYDADNTTLWYSGQLTNTTRRTLSQLFVGYLANVQVTYSSGNFSCDTITFDDMTRTSVSTGGYDVVENDVQRAFYDSARYSGIWSSVSTNIRETNTPLSPGRTIRQLIGSSMFPSSSGALTNRLSISVGNLGINATVVFWAGDTYVGSVDILLPDAVPFECTAQLDRSSTAEWTSSIDECRPTYNLRCMVPYNYPAKSAIDRGIVRTSRTIAVGMEKAFVGDESDTIPDIDQGFTYYGDPTTSTMLKVFDPNPVTYACTQIHYSSMRRETRTKVLGDMADKCGAAWNTGVIALRESMIDGSDAIMIYGGTYSFSLSLAGYDVADVLLVWTNVGGNAYDLTSILRYDTETQSYEEYAPDIYPTVNLVLHFENSGNGFKLSSGVPDVKKVAIDAAVTYLTRTEWDWNALRMNKGNK